MSLTEYRRKRQFGKTREPEPGKRLPEGQRAIFVVQLHHASRRHYDFRLQIGDALKSWAVPKGPSFDPSVKRMAVEVEDHPLDYATFQGDIPKGQYGGGHVAQFDHGVWSTGHDAEAQLAKGHLRFELFGEKLKGGWHLVRSGKSARQPQWLLFKENDAYAGKLEADDLLDDVTAPPAEDARRAGSGKPDKTHASAPAPARKRRIDWAKRAAKLTKAKPATLKQVAFAPQLARLGDKPPSGAQWLHEVKWDGYRLVATIVDGKAKLWSRNALEWTGKVPEIASALEQLGLKHAALDGELIAGGGTQADFNLLQATLAGEQHAPLTLALFDLLHVDGIAIDQAPLLERKRLLQQVLERPVRHLAYSSHIPADGEAAFKLASEQQFEGLISKRGDGAYHPGRGDDWRKTKRLQTDEYAVVGYTPAKGAREGFGALLLATPDTTHGWRYVGRVGSGFSDEQLRQLTARIGAAGTSRPSVHISDVQAKQIRGALWFAPKFVVEVVMRGIGSSGVLRQPSLKAVRLDKDVADLGDSDRDPPATASQAAKKSAASKSATNTVDAKKSATTKSVTKPAEPFRLTSPTKIIYASKHITKQDVADYYLAVMHRLLPEIAGRPLSVIRCPQGADKPCFFQKHHTPGLERVSLVRLKEEAGNNANYLVAHDAAAIMELVQLNALEFHPWGARADNPDICDRLVFDLDPGPGVPWREVKAAATHVRDLLATLDLKSYLRATGGKGLHVVVPLNPGCAWPLVKRFTHGFADALAGSDPLRYIAVSTLKLRPGKIFIDYLRNSRGATSVASYSLRAREGAPVAVPLAWPELGKLARPDAFDINSVPARLKRQKKDPWAGIDAVKQDLSRWS